MYVCIYVCMASLLVEWTGVTQSTGGPLYLWIQYLLFTVVKKKICKTKEINGS
jgi:hypothetical protein